MACCPIKGSLVAAATASLSFFATALLNPAQKVGGIGQIACAGHEDPCPADGGAFIGDYFGLAISEKNVYALFVSTHYPSTVTADGGGPVYYQQQVLSTVDRSAIGL